MNTNITYCSINFLSFPFAMPSSELLQAAFGLGQANPGSCLGVLLHERNCDSMILLVFSRRYPSTDELFLLL